MEQEEVIRRAVIEILVMLGSDEMLEHYVELGQVIAPSLGWRPAKPGVH
jgi:hypothetical protein